MEFNHVSVLLNETIDLLNIKEDGLYLDATVGGAGHSSKIIEKLTSGHLVCVDQDINAINASKERLKNFNNVTFIHSNFADVFDKLMEYGLFGFDGILMDLGFSSHQIDTAERGFSFMHDAKLDMRMKNTGLSAKDVVNGYDLKDLSRIFKDYGEEKYSGLIAKRIIRSREEKEIDTTFELRDLIFRSINHLTDQPLKSVMRIFQAIRIEVNDELNVLEKTIPRFIELLKPKGRLAIISFHSLEDRIVKQAFAFAQLDCICDKKSPICTCNKKSMGKIITKKPITPTDDEININSRAKSSKLRVFERK